MAFRYTGNRSDAEDMTQETLYRAFKNFHQLKDEAKCKSWMLAILRNIFLKEVSRGGRKNEVLQDKRAVYPDMLEHTSDNLLCPEGEAIKRGEEETVQKALREVPEKYKTPLLLFYMEEMAYEEISDALEIPIGTVMSRISRARGFVKKELIKNSADMERGGKLLKVAFGKSVKERGDR